MRSISKSLLFLIGLCATSLSMAIGAPKKATAEWTIVDYIQADNNLAPFAIYNINDMQQASLSSSVNMLVQWDQPNNNKTWRYRIVKGGRIEDASLSTEMGVNPVQELVDMMAWAKSKYAAKKYAVILWNHGSGVLDPRFQAIDKFFKFDAKLEKASKQTVPWLEVPGLSLQKKYKPEDPRGILFDDSQNTYATNQDLSTAFYRIKTEVLGKNIDIVGMDACLMAMLEVGYQIKDYANVLVGSEETEPGEGWAYSGFLIPLCARPTSFSATGLATAMVNAYNSFYQKRASDYTQSAIDLSKIDAIKANIASLIIKVDACKKADATRTKNIIRRARTTSTSFAVSDYIDLHSFYTALGLQLKKAQTVPSSKAVGNKQFTKAIAELLAIVNTGKQIITRAVIANAVGSQYASSVKGIAIYYPRGSVYSSYQSTKFAQDTQWIRFISTYK